MNRILVIVGLLAAVLAVQAPAADAELTKQGLGRTFFHPYGQCQVVPPDVTLPRAHVLCTADFPDLTGDDKPEQLTTIIELTPLGTMKCGTYILIDPACPSDRLCNRSLEAQKECF